MSRKVKGQKIDLAAFNGPTNDDITSRLPSAPSGIERDPSERRGGRGGDRYGDRGGGRSDDGPWGGGGRGGDRGGGFGDRGGGGFGGDGFGGGGDDGPWGRSRAGGGGMGGRMGGGFGGDRMGGGGGFGDRGDRGDRGGYGGDRGGNESAPERPAHMRLNLTSSRTPAAPMPPAVPSEAAPAAPVDKFAKAFGSAPPRAGADAGGRSGFSDRGGFERPSMRTGDARSSSGGGFGGGYGDRQGFGGGSSYRRNDDVDSDPRFSNRFGSGGYGDRGGHATQSAPVPLLPQKSQEDIKVEEEAKAAKVAKKAAREEVQRKEQEAKEAAAAAKAAALLAQQEADAAAANAAATTLVTGLKGDALAEYLSGLSAKPSGAALITELLTKESDPLSLKWCNPTEYGSAILSLVKGQPKEQMRALYAVQLHCHKNKFPKIDVKGSKRCLIDLIFQLLYKYEVIEDAGYLAWADDDEEVPGRLTAIVQTTEFMRVLTDVEVAEYDEDEEEEEIDAPQETV